MSTLGPTGPDLALAGDAGRLPLRLAGDWQRVRMMLEQLAVEAPVLPAAVASLGVGAGREQSWERALPPAPPPPGARLARRPGATPPQDAPQRPLELGYLELVVPVAEVARFLREGEAGPPAESDGWSRDLAGRAAMREPWPQVVGVVLAVREAYLQRFPRARAGFTLADVDRLLTVLVALPTYQLACRRGRREPGPLHPTLDALLRVAGALRRTTQQLLFVPEAGATWSPETRMRVDDLQAAAQRFAGLPEDAGPRDPLLAAVLDGLPAPGCAAPQAEPVQRALADLDAACEYALLGLQACAVLGSLGPLLARTHARMAGIVNDWRGPRTPTLERLQDWLVRGGFLLADHGFLASAQWRGSHERVHAESYAQCAAALGDPVRLSLADRIDGRLTQQHQPAADKLRALLQARCSSGDGGEDGNVEWLLDCLMHALVRTQQVLVLVGETQSRINTILQREQPHRDFTAADLPPHMLMHGSASRQLPQLLQELEQILGCRAAITALSLDIEET